MSGELRLSSELIKAIMQTVSTHDAAASDPFMAAQYLAAITAVVVAEMDAPGEDLKRVMSQLTGFSNYVLEEELKKRGKVQESFGHWKPGDA
ncbi:MAG: hypothetical protein H0W44_00460 [Gammaproteobacteria bacterium]|nr:hypothetical protein [Gammaproteobacteria bacterium]